jgi:glutamate--cysteine ligase
MEQIFHPHTLLSTASSFPLSTLEKNLLNQEAKIEAWLEMQWQKTPPPFYCSVDLRNAGFKLSPVDANLFPGGFNNLSPDFIPLCVQATQTTIQQLFPGTQGILLIPESHTRNPFYLENLAVLYEILVQTGLAVKIGSLRSDILTPETIALPSGRQLLFEPLARKEDYLTLLSSDFRSTSTLLLLNNDLSGNIPDILKNLQQPIHPSLNMSWASRLKSTHFAHYQALTAELAELITIDPWLINPLSYHCGEIDFMKREGEDCLTHNTNLLIKAIQQKYDEYGIKDKPFVVVKADSGTYGMAVMMVHDAKELRHLSRKKRTHMSTSKGGQAVSKVIIQEGVHTIEKCNNANAEPVIYMIGQQVVGAFYRVHPERSADDNLNSPGMYFEPLTLITENNLSTDDPRQRFYVYSVIARLAALACARELFFYDRKQAI